MSNANDSAYPRTGYSDGLTKRELFAAMAMQGFMSDPGEGAFPPGVDTLADIQRHYAKLATGYADALLAELAKEVKE